MNVQTQGLIGFQIIKVLRPDTGSARSSFFFAAFDVRGVDRGLRIREASLQEDNFRSLRELGIDK